MLRNPRAILVIVLLSGLGRIAHAQYGSAKPISEPTIFAPDIISTGDYEICPQFTLDGKTFYFVKSTPDANFWTIVFSQTSYAPTQRLPARLAARSASCRA